MPRKNAVKVYENLPFPIHRHHKSDKRRGWKFSGIIFDDVGHTFEWWYIQYIYATHCSCCNKKFENTRNRHLEHNHDITDKFNVRGIVCIKCNNTTKDVKMKADNTSGERHISFSKRDKKWRFQIQRKDIKFQKYCETKEEAIIERNKFINANPQMYSIK